MTIAQHITDRWAETEVVLRARPAVDYDAACNRAIQAQAALLYGQLGAPVPTLADLNNADVLVQQQLADLVVRQLIPLAKTTIAQTDTLSTSESLTPGGSGSTSYYNRVEVLDELKANLDAAIAERASLVAAAIRATLPPSSSVRTLPPFFARARSSRRGT